MRERVNLIPAPHVLAHRRARRVHAWLIGCGAYGLVLTVTAIALHLTLATPPHQLEYGLTDISHMRDRMQSQLEHLKSQRQVLLESHAAARAVGRQPDWSIALRLLAAGGAEGIALRRLELESIATGEDKRSLTADPEQYRIKLEGWAKSEAHLANLIRSIEAMKVFSRVRREGSTQEEVSGQHIIRFRLLCEIGAVKEKTP